MKNPLTDFEKRNKTTKELFPNNCPVMERTVDGDPVGRCWFYLYDGICPRHGDKENRINKHGARF